MWTEATTQASTHVKTEGTTEIATTTLSERCQDMITATEEKCGFNHINKPQTVDEEQCLDLLEILKEHCGYEIYQLSYNSFYKNFQ